MELQEAKDYVFQLMKDKDKIESELKALQEVLDTVCILKHNIASYQTLVYVTRNERNLRICKQHDLSFSRILPSVYVFFLQNNVGMDDPVVDSEGYPRNDIDVYQVRHARHKIICASNYSIIFLRDTLMPRTY